MKEIREDIEQFQRDFDWSWQGPTIRQIYAQNAEVEPAIVNGIKRFDQHPVRWPIR